MGIEAGRWGSGGMFWDLGYSLLSAENETLAPSFFWAGCRYNDKSSLGQFRSHCSQPLRMASSLDHRSVPLAV